MPPRNSIKTDNPYSGSKIRKVLIYWQATSVNKRRLGMDTLEADHLSQCINGIVIARLVGGVDSISILHSKISAPSCAQSIRVLLCSPACSYWLWMPSRPPSPWVGQQTKPRDKMFRRQGLGQRYPSVAAEQFAVPLDAPPLCARCAGGCAAMKWCDGGA